MHHLRCAFSHYRIVYLWAVCLPGKRQHYEAPWGSWEYDDHVCRSPLKHSWVVIDLHFLSRELAINPPVISFSSLRNFDWGPVTVPIQIDGAAQSQRTDLNCPYLETAVWFLFDNESGLIAQYDITFPRLAWATDYIKPFIKPQLVEELGSLADNRDDVDDLMHLRAAIDVCQEHETYCLGPYQQYESTPACIDYIYHKTPMGKVYEWGGDSGKPSFLTLTAFSIHETTFRTQPCVDTFIKVTPDSGHQHSPSVLIFSQA